MVRFLLALPGVGYLTIFLGKEKGKRITLPTFLKANSSELKTEFGALLEEDKNTFLTSYREAKDEKENTPLRVSNIAISKAVNAKMERITAMVCSYYCFEMLLIVL
jgi:hypothetical protein